MTDNCLGSEEFPTYNRKEGVYMPLWYLLPVSIYSKTCLKQPLKIDKTKVLKTNGSLMKVESIEECSKRAFCNTFDLH